MFWIETNVAFSLSRTCESADWDAFSAKLIKMHQPQVNSGVSIALCRVVSQGQFSCTWTAQGDVGPAAPGILLHRLNYISVQRCRISLVRVPEWSSILHKYTFDVRHSVSILKTPAVLTLSFSLLFNGWRFAFLHAVIKMMWLYLCSFQGFLVSRSFYFGIITIL